MADIKDIKDLSPHGNYRKSMNISQKIIRIDKVEDTRSYFEDEDDTWKPIPGSGDKRQCDRCKKYHEIHWYVTLEDSLGKLSDSIVGGSCAKKNNMDISDKELKDVSNSAIKIKKLQTALSNYEEVYELLNNFIKQSEKSTIPDIIDLQPDFPSQKKQIGIKLGNEIIKQPIFDRDTDKDIDEKIKQLKRDFIFKRAFNSFIEKHKDKVKQHPNFKYGFKVFGILIDNNILYRIEEKINKTRNTLNLIDKELKKDLKDIV